MMAAGSDPGQVADPVDGTVGVGGQHLVLIHGFTQTSKSWRRITEALSDGHRVDAVDAPGHGAAATQRFSLPQGAEAIADAGGPAVYIGYSMGARFALHVALQRPEVVAGLVLLSGTPGIADETERAARRASDEALATRLESIGTAAFIEQWLQNPLFATLPYDEAERADRCTNTAAGLASSLRLAGTGTQLPLWDRFSGLTMPVLVVAGALDDKFTEIGRAMARRIGRSAQFESIADAGHSAHLERPDEFLDIVRPWLDGLVD